MVEYLARVNDVRGQVYPIKVCMVFFAVQPYWRSS